MALVAGCTQPPERVFVPGSPFTHIVEARTAQGVTADIKMGEWLDLHARRRTGPWTEVDRKSSDPLKTGEFEDGLRPDRVRRVRFSAPGRYVLRATSSTWCSPKVNSNILVIVVRP